MILGCDLGRRVDAVFVNSPLKNYDRSPRRNTFTLPVLGLAYIATYAQRHGWNVGLLDAEAEGLGVSAIGEAVNEAHPRWVGMMF